MENLQQIAISTLKEGMKFSAPLFFDDGENMFLSKGHAVSAYHLDVLKRWKIPFVLTSGHLMTSSEPDVVPEELESIDELDEVEELDDADEVEDLEELEDLDEEIVQRAQKKTPDDYKKIYQRDLSALTDIFNRYVSKVPVDRAEVDSIARDIVEVVEQEQTMAMAYILNQGKSGSLVEAAGNIAIISATVAFHMQIPRQRVMQLVIAALLHDIGMMQIPETVLNKKNVLTSQEFEQLKLHTIYSSRFVSDSLMLPRETANCVLQHHERWDGSGYPNGRKGTDIDLLARILAVADSFEALVGKKSYHDAIISYEAMKTLLAESGTHFDSDVLKAFVQTMGVYPIGSIVQLSNGAVAKVIEAGVESPFLPVVKMQGDAGAVIKLKQQTALFIVRVVAPK